MSSALIRNINYLLKEKNVTRNAVAKSAGLTPSTLGRLLDEKNYSGRRPREKTIVEIAKFFEVSPADLERDDFIQKRIFTATAFLLQRIPLLTVEQLIKYSSARNRRLEDVINSADLKWVPPAPNYVHASRFRNIRNLTLFSFLAPDDSLSPRILKNDLLYLTWVDFERGVFPGNYDAVLIRDDKGKLTLREVMSPNEGEDYFQRTVSPNWPYKEWQPVADPRDFICLVIGLYRSMTL